MQARRVFPLAALLGCRSAPRVLAPACGMQEAHCRPQARVARLATLAELTAEVVSAYVSKNPLPAAALPDLIASVHASLSGLNRPADPPAVPLVPAANPKRSVFPDYIVCLEDGKKFKSLKRHLATHFNLSPDQ